jgi:hypothetical protein
MHSIKLSLLLLAVLYAAAAPPTAQARAASRETEWSQVLLEGRKIGWSKHVRHETRDRITTTEVLHVTLDRIGTSVHLETEQESVESTDARPLGFRFKSSLSGRSTEIRGEVDANGRIVLKEGAEGATAPATWPEGALLAEGLRRLERARGLEPGTEYRALAFQPDMLAAVDSTVTVVGKERISVLGRQHFLTHVVERVELPGAAMEIQIWVDDEFRAQRIQLPLLGMTLELLACDERQARAPDQPADVLEHTVVAAPRSLGGPDLAGSLRYELLLPDEKDVPSLPGTGEQQVKDLGAGRIEVTVAALSQADGRAPPDAADSRPTRWLQSDAEQLRKLASGAVAGASDDRARMLKLEKFVRGYITRKNLSVGYASALETVRSREGDCTEHALLLAALGRSAGIPTRVVDGLAYTESFGGRTHLFVPHAWAQAWVDGRWQSYDAALAGFDAGHIALNVGDGDPAGFYAGVSLLGRIKLERIEVVAP